MKNIKNIIPVIFKGVVLAMGVAVTVLSILNEIDTNSAIRLLAIGLAGSGIAHFINNEKS